MRLQNCKRPNSSPMVTFAPTPAIMVKTSDGKLSWLWVSMRLPAQEPMFLTGTLAIFKRCSASCSKLVDLDRLSWSRLIRLEREMAAPTWSEESPT